MRVGVVCAVGRVLRRWSVGVVRVGCAHWAKFSVSSRTKRRRASKQSREHEGRPTGTARLAIIYLVTRLKAETEPQNDPISAQRPS